MSLTVSQVDVKSVLTRTGGYLAGVASHSLQPYRGCTFANALCGVGCYVQHNAYVTRGRPWGTFLEVRRNSADVYRRQYPLEREWTRRTSKEFSIFCSSSTDPFLPQESNYRITRSVLEAMIDLPPDRLVLQTHTHLVAKEVVLISRLSKITKLRVHLTMETDREAIDGMPPHASPIEKRFLAAEKLREAKIETIITVAPLLPIREPVQFFERISKVADGVVIDHFVEGDGSKNGSRTRKTMLPIVMEMMEPRSTTLAYRDEMVAVAKSIMPGRVGVSAAGFAGSYSA